MSTSLSVLLVEPFNGGSHKQLIDLLSITIPDSTVYSLTAKKWHWRARTSALYFSELLPHEENSRVLFASSVLNLAELTALRPDLQKLKKVLYFHENQLVYPVRKQQDRDFQYGYNQIISCLVADVVVFNSQFNLDSFLNSVDSYMKLIPDYRPRGLAEKIRPKCQVLYFPLLFNKITLKPTKNEEASVGRIIHIVWPHRWEHDKNPNLFFTTLYRLQEEGMKFNVSVMGEMYTDVPEIFSEAKLKLEESILHWGYEDSKEEYYNILQSADVVVSTANHEFFGVAVLEAVYCGCYPVVPNRLVYPELYPRECLFNTDQQLYKMLKRFCKIPELITRKKKPEIDLERFSWTKLEAAYKALLQTS